MNILYPAKITFSNQDARFTVEFLDFPEAITEGASLEEALQNAAEVLTLTLEGRMDEEMQIVAPTNFTKKNKNIYYIAPAARVQAALLVKTSLSSVTKAAIARSLETSWPAIARMENPHHSPTLRQLEKLAAAVGKRLVISLE